MSEPRKPRPNSRPRSGNSGFSNSGPNRRPTNKKPTSSNRRPPAKPKPNNPSVQTEPDIMTVAVEPQEFVPIEAKTPEYLIIAEITTTFGLRGAVKAEIRTDFPERFDDLKEVWLAPPGAPTDAPREARNVVEARIQNDRQAVIKFEGASKPEHAEALRGYTVAIPTAESASLEEGEYYIYQIVGLDVYSLEGQYVGQVINVLRYPANDVYEVRGPLSAKPFLLPAVKDVVQDIDLENRRITIDLLDGLI